jgi:hypothetical protein
LLLLHKRMIELDYVFMLELFQGFGLLIDILNHVCRLY